MSVPRGKGQNGGHFYSNITSPVKIDCQFVVDSSNSNGLGIRSLKSNGYIQSVFMNTSATPASGSPNPAAGNALVVFNNNFNTFLGLTSSLQSPLTGGNLTAVVAGIAYVITALGTATDAQWQAVGLPPGFDPAVGFGFIATASATIGGSATVKLPGVSGVLVAELVGDVNQSINNENIYVDGGAELVLQFLDGTPAKSAPADESVVNLSFYFDGSSVTIDGL